MLHGVVIEPSRDSSNVEPVDLRAAAVHAGDSLIIFPGGTRNGTDDLLPPMKSGIYHLAQQCAGVEVLPV